MTRAGTDGALLSSEQLAEIRNRVKGKTPVQTISAGFAQGLLTHLDALTARLAAAERELAVMRPVARSASDADWHFKQHGEGRLVDADYAVLWRLRDNLESLRQWAANDAATPRQPGDAGERNAK